MHIRNLSITVFAVTACFVAPLTNADPIIIRAGKLLDVVSGNVLDKEPIRMARQRGTALSIDICNTEYTLSEGEKNGVPRENIDKEGEVGTRQRESFRMAVEAGAIVVFGSDAGVCPHGDNGKQFSRMVQFGMTPIQALQAATIHTAELLQRGDELGQLSSGYYADIIAVDEDPLQDIGVMESVSFVMKNGVVYKND